MLWLLLWACADGDLETDPPPSDEPFAPSWSPLEGTYVMSGTVQADTCGFAVALGMSVHVQEVRTTTQTFGVWTEIGTAACTYELDGAFQCQVVQEIPATHLGQENDGAVLMRESLAGTVDGDGQMAVARTWSYSCVDIPDCESTAEPLGLPQVPCESTFGGSAVWTEDAVPPWES